MQHKGLQPVDGSKRNRYQLGEHLIGKGGYGKVRRQDAVLHVGHNDSKMGKAMQDSAKPGILLCRIACTARLAKKQSELVLVLQESSEYTHVTHSASSGKLCADVQHPCHAEGSVPGGHMGLFVTKRLLQHCHFLQGGGQSVPEGKTEAQTLRHRPAHTHKCEYACTISAKLPHVYLTNLKYSICVYKCWQALTMTLAAECTVRFHSAHQGQAD